MRDKIDIEKRILETIKLTAKNRKLLDKEHQEKLDAAMMRYLVSNDPGYALSIYMIYEKYAEEEER